MQTKQKRNPVKFEDDKPVEIVFDYDVDTSKSFEMDSQYTESGKVVKYTVAVNKNDIIFASEALFKKIRDFKRGDKTTITFSEKRWMVKDEPKTSFQKEYEDRSVMAALTQIMSDIEAIKNKLLNEEPKNYPSDDQISF